MKRKIIIVSTLLALGWLLFGCKNKVSTVSTKTSYIKPKNLISEKPRIFYLGYTKIPSKYKLIECRSLSVDYYLPYGKGIIQFSPRKDFSIVWEEDNINLDTINGISKTSRIFEFYKNIPTNRKVYIRIKDSRTGLSSGVGVIMSL